MKCLFKVADKYIKQCNWQDLALIKICLCSMGIMWGIATPKKYRKPVVFVAVFAFVATYIPLILKFLPMLLECGNNSAVEEDNLTF